MEGDMSKNELSMLNFEDIKLNFQNRINFLQICYRGEGNESLVLNLPKFKFVLRFRKCLPNDAIDKEKEAFKTSFLYHYIFIQFLFTEMYLALPVLAEISDAEIERLHNEFYAERLDYRREKRVLFGGLEIFPDYTFLPQYSEYIKLRHKLHTKQAPETNLIKKILSSSYLNYRNFVFTLLTDHIFANEFITMSKQNNIPTYCIEIKPKLAWTAKSDQQFELCAYCMNQYFKLCKRKTKCRSNYCPLDLFSGDIKRMKRALSELLKTPQNNLKIFKNGKLVFGENSENVIDVLCEWFYNNENKNTTSDRCIDSFCHLVTSVLLTEFGDIKKIPLLTCESYVETKDRKLYDDHDVILFKEKIRALNLSCTFKNSYLPDNCILNRIVSLQRVDQAGLKAATDFYETHMNKYTSEYSYVGDLISRTKFSEEGIHMPELNVVEAYLLSTAAKDLSILIAIKNISHDEESSSSKCNILRDMENKMYSVNVSVVDVGPKPISCIRKHWERNKNVLTSCLNFFCSDLNSNNL